MLLPALLSILQGWIPAFCQARSGRRAVAQALGSLLALGRRTLSRSLWALGKQQQDWSAEYKLHARAKWDPAALFQAILQGAAPLCSGPFLVVALDDTRIHKTGRKITSASYQRDPLSPKFRFNLMWGLRFLHLTLLVPLYRSFPDAAPRSLPLRFHEVPALKKPGKKATAEQRQLYAELVKHNNLSQHSLLQLEGLRRSADTAALQDRLILAVGDNSFCNRTLLRQRLDRIELLARSRKDIRLCRPATPGGRRFYDTQKFTPEQIRQQDSLCWQQAHIFHGGKWRDVRYKEISEVYWQGGGRRRPLRLLVVAPIPYDSGKGNRKYYREPAFLLTTALQAPADILLQAYFDRWQIEVNHRELKDTLGVGQAQLRNPRAVPRQPAMVVAAYSALLLAGIQAFGASRSDAFPALPKWRRHARRPSCLDLLTVLRNEIDSCKQTQCPLLPLLNDINWKNLGLSAAA
jgi:DDE superfamily endonuclease